jgi:hypothetical protein
VQVLRAFALHYAVTQDLTAGKASPHARLVEGAYHSQSDEPSPNGVVAAGDRATARMKEYRQINLDSDPNEG